VRPPGLAPPFFAEETSLNSLPDDEFTRADYDEVHNANSLLSEASRTIYGEPFHCFRDVACQVG
jgi:hypothetical protein